MNPGDEHEMLAEYDFSQGVQGRYAQPHAEGGHVVVLDPDVASFSQRSFCEPRPAGPGSRNPGPSGQGKRALTQLALADEGIAGGLGGP